MENNKTIPKIRFTGFTDAWELRRLGDLLVERNIQVPENEEYPLMSFVQGLGVTPKGDRYDRSFLVTSSEKKYKVTEYGDFIYSSNNLETGSIGFNRSGKAVISPVYSIFYSKNNLESRYIGILSTRKDFIAKMIRYRQGVIYGQWRIHESDFLEIKILIPTEKEQKEIIQIFDTFDNLITLHQRECDLLVKTKKSYLQKMFPKNGEDKPEIRFAGFTDAWEQRRLGEVANHRGGTAIEKHFDNSGKYKVISIGSYGLDSKYVDQNIRAISNEITDARVVRKGELTMVLNDKTSNGTIIGRSLLINTDDEYVINQRTEIISPKENLDSDFAYVVLNGPFREKVKRIVQGGTQIYVNYPAVENLEFELPSIEEQQKIGDFFIQLDHLITLHQRELNSLKNMKKSLLQQMFI